jgi:hypothetical protein
MSGGRHSRHFSGSPLLELRKFTIKIYSSYRSPGDKAQAQN